MSFSPQATRTRPFCSGGVALCRTSGSAVARYDHASVTGDDDLVGVGGMKLQRAELCHLEIMAWQVDSAVRMQAQLLPCPPFKA